MARASRVRCLSHGVLSSRGITQQVILENISLEGALVIVENYVESAIDSNDIFQLALSDNPDLCPPMYACRVVRVTADGKVGIKFLEHVWNSTGLI